MKRLTLAFLFSVLLPAVLCPQEADFRGLKKRVNQLAGPTAAVGRQYAVLIAVNKYLHWNALQNPVKDALEIKEILSRRYYVNEFIELYDEAATKAGIIKLFDGLIRTCKPEDSVFIFYAGHGHLDRISDTGFWIPVDGGTDRYEQTNWLPNTQIRGFISKMKARHIALVSDACFAGDILNPTRAISPEISSEYFRNAYARVSRQVLTSGASEAVPDESPFARGLKLALEGNTSPYLDPLLLYREVRLGVKGSTPLFGDLKDSGHQEGASFLLFLREAPPEPKAAPKAEPAPKVTFKLEKSYGTLKVDTRTAGQLYIDEVFQGAVPADGRASIENLEAGEHLLEIWYEDGGYESLAVTVARDAETKAAFACLKPKTPEPAPPVPAAEAPANLLPELKDQDAIPVAAIEIDGKFEDWEGIPPAFIGFLTSFGSMDIDKVFLAKDEKYLYLRMDIADTTPRSLLRPHNFDTRNWSDYGITLNNSNPAYWIAFSLIYTKGSKNQAWVNQVSKDNGNWELLSNAGSHSLEGSSFEASFPLSAVRKYLVEGNTYQVFCHAGYSEKDKWVLVDEMKGKAFRF